MSLADHLRRDKARARDRAEGPMRDRRMPVDLPLAVAEPDNALADQLCQLIGGPELSRVGGDWVHASQLWDLCTRQVVLGREARADGRELLAILGASRRWRYDLGQAVHDLLRDRYLGPSGCLLGGWRCNTCDVTWPDPTDVAALEPRPKRCGVCGDPDLRFCEPEFRNEPLRVVGHCDGIVRDPRRGRGVLEIKSVDHALFRSKLLPLAEHVFRAHVYCWLAGLKWGLILYATTGLDARLPPFRGFRVQYDLRVSGWVKRRLADVASGGARACKSASDARAAECPVARECWAR